MKISPINFNCNPAGETKVKKADANSAQTKQTQITKLSNHQVYFGYFSNMVDFNRHDLEYFKKNQDGTYKNSPESLAYGLTRTSDETGSVTLFDIKTEQLCELFLGKNGLAKNNPLATALSLTYREQNEELSTNGWNCLHQWLNDIWLQDKEMHSEINEGKLPKRIEMVIEALKDQPMALRDIFLTQDAEGNTPLHMLRRECELPVQGMIKNKLRSVGISEGFIKSLEKIPNIYGRTPKIPVKEVMEIYVGDGWPELGEDEQLKSGKKSKPKVAKKYPYKKADTMD